VEGKGGIVGEVDNYRIRLDGEQRGGGWDRMR